MFGSEIIDTAIGLVFVFLLVSVLVTVLNELIAALLLSRAKWLQFGIARLIGPDWATRLYAHPLVEGTGASTQPVLVGPGRNWRGGGPSYLPSRTFADVLVHLVIEHDRWLPPLAAAVRRAVLDGDDRGVAERVAAAVARLPDAPSYRAIVDDLTTALRATRTSSLAELDAFVDAMPDRYLAQVVERLPPHDKLGRTLQLLIREARGDVERFKQSIEVWFDNAMDRVSGWYKRRSQWVAFALGLGAAVVLNVDPLAIGDYLQTHAGVRDAIVAKARAYGAIPPPALTGTDADAPAARQFAVVQSTFADTRRDLASLGLPIAWNGADPQVALGWRAVVAAHALGWLITAFAATLGAPFWFDLLNRIVSIRSAGRAPEEKPRAPKEQPLPLGPGEEPAAARLVAAAAHDA